MPLMKASILVVLAIAAVVILHRTWPNSQTQLPPPLELVQPSSAIQWPTAYGVYAVGDGQLQELERVPSRVSDHGHHVDETQSHHASQWASFVPCPSTRHGHGAY
jgi:hypothetical protein